MRPSRPSESHGYLSTPWIPRIDLDRTEAATPPAGAAGPGKPHTPAPVPAIPAGGTVNDGITDPTRPQRQSPAAMQITD